MASEVRYTFGKQDRLFLRNRVDKLFSHGKVFFQYPYRVAYLFLPVNDESLFVAKKNVITSDIELLISIPKRRLPHAVDRNRSKRITREAYRLQRAHLVEKVNLRQQHLLLGLIQMSDKVITFEESTKSIKKILHRLEKESSQRDFRQKRK